ncbi:hypothetical protein L218DRAFT_957467 [Marasmius fiardii PR-910]|nr:hypothetical protein L218DRAFT_957467 [Marasmius fiardii PR-910]
MKFFTTAVIAASVIAGTTATPVRRGVPANLIPQFGHQAGLNPTGTGDCDGIPGAPKIPCSCPPPRNDFINALNANVAAGHAVKNPSVPVSFPTSNSKGDQIARLQASLVTLQNLNGPGVGCPAVSTTFLKQLQALQKRDHDENSEDFDVEVANEEPEEEEDQEIEARDEGDNDEGENNDGEDETDDEGDNDEGENNDGEDEADDEEI